jgi:hypothetical protein
MNFGDIPDPVQRERQLDYNRAIAQKIRNRLQQLDNATEKDKRRWVWELLQNAKDSINEGTVDIRITTSLDCVEFSHNGGFFSPRNITNLIHQISSKEGEDGKVGRFGTGFLTTHTLSRKVEVKGVFFDGEKYYEFQLLLDRSSSTEAGLVKAIEESWNSFKSNEIAKPDGKVWTTFRYLKPDIDVAASTLKDFETFIHFNLAFVPEIGKVTIITHKDISETTFKLGEDPIEIEPGLFRYLFYKEDRPIYLLVAKNEEISIAIEIAKSGEVFGFKHIEKNVPRLFCAFPLIGSEEFTFPMIVNSESFLPKTERDMIYLKGDAPDVLNNQRLMGQGVELFERIVKYCSLNRWHDFFAVANTKLPKENEDLDRVWFQNEIQKPIRTMLAQLPIVQTESGELISILDNEENDNVYFPDHSIAETREKIWEYGFDLFPDNIPKRAHIHEWYKILWSACSRQKVESFAEVDLKNTGSLENLKEELGKDISATEDWLNRILQFIEGEASEIFDAYEVLPNQHGVFKLRKDLYEDKGIAKEFKEILLSLGVDWFEQLLNPAIKIKMNSYRTVSAISDSINGIIRKNENKYQDSEFNKALYSLVALGNAQMTKEHEKVWEFSRALYFTEVPEKISIVSNSEKFDWKDCLHWQVNKLVKDISVFKYVEVLQGELHGSIQVLDWLAGFIDFIQQNEAYRAFLDDSEHPILPNQNGMFCEKSQLFLDDGSIPDKLKKVLNFFNPEWLGELLDKKIYLDLPSNRSRNFEDIAEEIDKAFKGFHESKQEPGFVSAYRYLTAWFKGKSDDYIKTHFDWIFRHKAELSLGIMGNDEDRDNIFRIIESGKAHIFSKIANNVEITEEDLIEFSNNPDDFRKYKEWKASGTSGFSTEDFFRELSEKTGTKVDSMEALIEKIGTKPKRFNVNRNVDWAAISLSNETAKERIYEHLKTLESYDLSGWKERSATIIEGVKKSGIDITLVTKGANNGNIILDKAGKEKIVLKDTFSELWIQRDEDVFQITLGEFIEEWDIEFIEAGKFDFH